MATSPLLLFGLWLLGLPRYRAQGTDLLLPPGEAWEITLGASSGVVSPAERVTKTAPRAASAALEEIRHDLLGLRLSHQDDTRRFIILTNLEPPVPGRPYADASAVEALGVNPDSPQGATQRSIAARLRALE